MSESLFSIRLAEACDAEAIAEIYNEAIRITTATFDTEAKSVENRLEWLNSHDERHPVFVAEADGKVVGWGALSSWSDRPAYNETAETSFYVAESFRGRGIGRALKRRLIDEARRFGFHTLLARAAEDSLASIHLNESCGFRLIGTMKEVGFKFGRRLDVHVMQLMLKNSSVEMPETNEEEKSSQSKAGNSIYDEDLAYIHDVGYSSLSESWTPGLLELFREAGIHTGTVVDLGCGGGGWVKKLVESGYQAIGVDVSAAMIERSQQRVSSATFDVGSIWDYSFPRCHVVTALSEVLCYRRGEEDDPNPKLFFENIFKALEPGGLFIFDVAEIGLDQGRNRTFAEGNDWSCLVKYEYDETKNRLHRQITTFRQVDTLYRRSQEQHAIQLYDPKRVAEMLKGIGFHVQVVRQFGGAALLPQRAGFVATKAK